MGDIIVIAIIVLISFFAIRKTLSKKDGCSSCHMAGECKKKRKQ